MRVAAYRRQPAREIVTVHQHRFSLFRLSVFSSIIFALFT
jgi:hypothetical protein